MMTINKILFVLLCSIYLPLIISCNNDDDIKEEIYKENNWLLVGKWTLNSSLSDNNDVASIIVFNEDGSGLYDDVKFRWYNNDRQIFINLENGKRIENFYYIQGATLDIEGLGTYITQLPITGVWYANNAMKQFDSEVFCYFFKEDGRGLKYTFDYIGLSVKTEFKWDRTNEGIKIKYKYVTEDKECNINDSVMDIKGEGSYTKELPFYGKWKAVDCNKGLIFEGDDNFSLLDIKVKGNDKFFVCNYKSISDDVLYDKTYNGSLTIANSHQFEFYDQQIFIIKDINNESDAQVIHFRYFYYPPRQKVYLDLGLDAKLKEFVRYELIG